MKSQVLRSWFLWAWMAAVPLAHAIEVFVAPDGDDHNPGTRAAPVATLEAGRDRLRTLRTARRGASTPARLWLRGGTYARTQTFELDARDSGTATAPLQIAPWRNEPVRLSGGIVLGSFGAVTDARLLARLPAAARARVRAVGLPSGFPADGFTMRSRGFGRPITPAYPELFVAGKPMTLARWPNAGEWANLAGFPAASGQGDDHGGKIGTLPGGFYYDGDRPRGWQEPMAAWVHGYWAWDWANSYERVETIDLDRRWIRTAAPHGLYGFRKGQRFHFLNVLEELDAPGEWYLDPATRQVLLWPPEEADTAAAADGAILSMLETPLIRVRDARYVEITGLRLEASRGHGIVIEGGAEVGVTACALRLLGNYGVWIEGGEGHHVVGCAVADTGDGGVSLTGGDRQTLRPGRHRVEHTRFERQGRWSKCYVPAVLVAGVGHRIAHNHISDHPHCAILFTGNDHTFEYNEIHRVALETGDVGAIYVGRDWTYRGNSIRYNYIHDTGGVGMGSMGAYMDDCVSGTEIRGNVFERVQRAAFIGGGRDHAVINNLFIDCHPAVQIDGRGLDPSPVWHDMVFDFMRRQMAAVPAELYRRRYPEIGTLDAPYAEGRGVAPENNVVAHNICIGGEWLSVHWHAKPEHVQVVSNYVGTTPGFRDQARRDYTPAPGSPAAAIGFGALTLERVGPQDVPEVRRLRRYVLEVAR